jgi:hypothetical protein
MTLKNPTTCPACRHTHFLYFTDLRSFGIHWYNCPKCKSQLYVKWIWKGPTLTVGDAHLDLTPKHPGSSA